MSVYWLCNFSYCNEENYAISFMHLFYIQLPILHVHTKTKKLIAITQGNHQKLGYNTYNLR